MRLDAFLESIKPVDPPALKIAVQVGITDEIQLPDGRWAEVVRHLLGYPNKKDLRYRDPDTGEYVLWRLEVAEEVMTREKHDVTD